MVPPSSHRVSRVRRYSGYSLQDSVFNYGALTLCRRPSHAVRLTYLAVMRVRTPKNRSPSVWPLPRSLATTCGISVDFSSSSYLDVSVQTVPYTYLFDSACVDRLFTCRVAPFGNPRINAYVPLPVAYRSLSRPSSAPDAKASSLRPSSLDLCRRSFRRSTVSSK